MMTGVSDDSVYHGLEAARNGSVKHHYETIAVVQERILLVAVETSLCLPEPPPDSTRFNAIIVSVRKCN